MAERQFVVHRSSNVRPVEHVTAETFVLEDGNYFFRDGSGNNVGMFPKGWVADIVEVREK